MPVKPGEGKNLAITSAAMCGRFTRYLPWPEMIVRLYRLTLIIEPPVESMNQLHDGMPVVLDHVAYNAGLVPSTTVPKQVLSQCLNSSLEFYRVGRQVNSSKYEGTDCIEPVNPL